MLNREQFVSYSLWKSPKSYLSCSLQVIQNNLHPVWKMLIDLPVDNPESLDDLLMALFDEDNYGKDESLGKCTIPVQILRTAITSGQTQVIL